MPINVNDAQSILNPRDAGGEMLFRKAEEIGRELVDKKVSMSQIRKLFSEIKKIEYDAQKNYQYKLRLLKAQIGYTSGRFREFSYFKESFYNLIDKTLSGGEAELKRFKDFFEATIAYFRAFGGK
ncbi:MULTISPECIES: type III-A CRISPR-associated protein Csm2 [Caloramator]|uniref:CRISPR system Cms protein Csm2 n=1 Tax=Caloramator australicus RC3 TaxID=857293 RepID=I7J6U4_9CLOT|nr:MULTISPECIES: type III-A CRISPR-associated protein Csm2 [Caloramator]MDO6354575.1 type III-A CRISPR-associated protein Csm2 [Caloramator sp. CAR-1]CCJ34759.1 CRISPR-associated protein, Csm2 family [Caloramator australicus RC3]